jgi:hypothetical protein
MLSYDNWTNRFATPPDVAEAEKPLGCCVAWTGPRCKYLSGVFWDTSFQEEGGGLAIARGHELLWLFSFRSEYSRVKYGLVVFDIVVAHNWNMSRAAISSSGFSTLPIPLWLPTQLS